MPERFDTIARRPTSSPRTLAARELRLFLVRMGLLGVVLVLLLLAGAIGFMLTEHVSLGYGFVQALDTIATVGSIPEPHNSAAQAVKVGLIVLGVGTLFYALVTLTEFFVTGRLSGLLEDRRTQKMIESLTNHYVICGFGRVGRQVARDLRAAGARFAVVDPNPENRELALQAGVPFVEGSPSDDEMLSQAGLDRARGVLACVDSDAENIFIALTARGMRPDVLIVARASAEEAEAKLRRAGADRIISPYRSSGREMASLALHPQVSGVVEVSPEYRLEEIEVSLGCGADGRRIADVRGGALFVALRRADGTLKPQPPDDQLLHQGDIVIALGTPDALKRIEVLFQPEPAG